MNVVQDVIAVITKTTIILSIASVLSLVLRRASASTRHAVWMLAMLSVILVPIALAFMPHFELPVLPRTRADVAILAVNEPPIVIAGTVERGLEPSTTYLTPAAFRLAMAWMLVASLLLIRLLLSGLAIHRLSRAAVPLEDGAWRDIVAKVSAALFISRPVRLRVTDLPISPLTWGVFQHTILLPSSALSWPAGRARLVLAHELAHVKRKDGIMQIFVQIICTLYWFNPLVWYAAHRVRIERERACDDHVLGLGTAAEDYADHLVQIVRGLRGKVSLSFAAVSMAQPSQLETRLVSILDSRVRRRRLSYVTTSFLCALTVTLTISASAIAFTSAVALPAISVVTTKLASAPSATAPAPAPPPAPAAARAQRTRIGDGATTSNNTVVPPKVIESSAPRYTDEGIAARIEGTVTLEAAVDVEGKVTVLRVVKGLGYGLDQRAIGAILDWKFTPATKDGAPVQTVTQIDVDFKLPPERIINGVPVLRIGGDVRPPTIISRVEPKSSDEARNAHYQGTIVLEAIVKKDGTVDIARVVRSLGLGLDETAIEALKQWKFKPATRNGEPVDVAVNIEVNFNLRDGGPATGGTPGAAAAGAGDTGSREARLKVDAEPK